jgi:hypothetical protein
MEKVNIFFDYLKRTIKTESFTSNDLIALLDKNMFDMTLVERVELLNNLYKFWYETKEIDAYHKGDIMPFINYVEFRIREESRNKGTDDNWRALFNDLIEGYISDISLNDFNEVMTHHRLPWGKGRIKWLSSKANGVRFSEYFKFKMEKFNECFISNDGIKFHLKNRSNTVPEKHFKDLLERHKRP